MGRASNVSAFHPEEIEYLQSQQHGRLATVNDACQPHVVPVAYRYDAEADVIEVGGPVLAHTKKFRDVQVNGRVALVVDDILPPWLPRGIEIRGRAQILPTGGDRIHPGFAPEVIRITPHRIAWWGIRGEDTRSSRSVRASEEHE